MSVAALGSSREWLCSCKGRSIYLKSHQSKDRPHRYTNPCLYFRPQGRHLPNCVWCIKILKNSTGEERSIENHLRANFNWTAAAVPSVMCLEVFDLLLMCICSIYSTWGMFFIPRTSFYMSNNSGCVSYIEGRCVYFKEISLNFLFSSGHYDSIKQT